MNGGRQAGLWILALSGSLALHGAVGMAMIAMPMPEARPKVETEITIETLSEGSVTTLAPAVEAKIAAASPAAPVASVETSVAPTVVSASKPVEVQPVSDGLQPIEADRDVAPSATSETVIAATEEPETIAEPDTASVPLAPVVAEESTAAQAAPEVVALAPAEDSREVALAVEESAPVESLETLPATPPAELAPSVIAPSLAPIEPVAETAVPETLAARETELAPEAVAPAAAAVDPVVAPLIPETVAPPLAATVAAPPPAAKVLAPPPAATLTTPPPAATVIAPKQVESAATTHIDPAAKSAVAAPVASPAPAAKTVASPSAKVAVAAPVQPSSQAATPAPIQPRSQSTSTTRVAPPVAVAVPSTVPVTGTPGAVSPKAVVAAPVGSRVVAGTSTQPATVESQVVAMLPRPEVRVDGQGSGGTAALETELASFLATHESGDCVLAVPSVVKEDEATIDGFSIAPTDVFRIGRAFQRESGVSVKTNISRVTEGQCSALAFSRALPQYPNYPLKLTLDAPTIRSGAILSGTVAGLRKPNLYLVVVDDEGKAKLINSFPGMTKTTIPFDAPMTLTSGPVASVQLLVAIASDVPLTTIATRDGIPAKAFFDGVAGEIINQNRSIHYGITSFIVR